MPVIGNKLYCPAPYCNYEQPQINLVKCKRCGCDLGAPNVNEASTEDEINALSDRYILAVGQLNAEGNIPILAAFEQFFNDNIQAVINIDFYPLVRWVLDKDSYNNYYRLTQEGKRDIATPENDRKRNKVDSYLFGSYGRDIIFAALSLNNTGLKSYGNCTVSLEDNIIIPRSTVIEENSYNFAKRHDINFEVVKIPKGYRAIWGNKLKLAVAKLQSLLKAPSNSQIFCNLVLYSDGNRETEEFMEVHIYNELSEFAVNNIYLPKLTGKKAMLDLKKINDKYPGRVFEV